MGLKKILKVSGIVIVSAFYAVALLLLLFKAEESGEGLCLRFTDHEQHAAAQYKMLLAQRPPGVTALPPPAGPCYQELYEEFFVLPALFVFCLAGLAVMQRFSAKKDTLRFFLAYGLHAVLFASAMCLLNLFFQIGGPDAAAVGRIILMLPKYLVFAAAAWVAAVRTPGFVYGKSL